MSGRGTSTRRFGSGKRESHDASAFYARFAAPVVSDDDVVNVVELPDGEAGSLLVGDSRHMDLPDNSVALVVTSPPYFAGKAYEESLGTGGIPADYCDYLAMLRDVLAECVRVLEPGGRLAVNVANLGRRPYRSLAADVIGIVQDDLGLLLRGEIVWAKAEGASGSCAWGSFRSAANPVLRDITERVIVASKGRFDRAPDPARRRQRGLPAQSCMTNDEFMEATLDLWSLPPESARRVGHPAPFPLELPLRLIDLYTYRDDLVLDPFLGSGTTAVAAARRGRKWWGYDTDASYVEIARRRVREEIHSLDAGELFPDAHRDRASRIARRDTAVESGRSAAGLASDLLAQAGFVDIRRGARVPAAGAEMSFSATGADGQRWYFDLTGSFTAASRGLAGSALWASLGRAAAVAAAGDGRVVLLTTSPPPGRSAGERAIRALGPSVVFDVIDLLDPDAPGRLRTCSGGATDSTSGDRDQGGFWA